MLLLLLSLPLMPSLLPSEVLAVGEGRGVAGGRAIAEGSAVAGGGAVTATPMLAALLPVGWAARLSMGVPAPLAGPAALG